MIQKKTLLWHLHVVCMGKQFTASWDELFVGKDFDLPIWDPEHDDDEKDGFFVRVEIMEGVANVVQ